MYIYIFYTYITYVLRIYKDIYICMHAKIKKIGVDQVFQGMILNRIIENKTQSQIKDNEGLKKIEYLTRQTRKKDDSWEMRTLRIRSKVKSKG